MARNWMKSEQRSYRAKRKKKAQLVADRLMGRKKYVPPAHDDFMDAMSYKWATKLYVSNPRTSAIITGIEGV